MHVVQKFWATFFISQRNLGLKKLIFCRLSCKNCTNNLCMWCKNLGMCVDRNAYLASFPYGQCMDWTTHPEECPESLNPGQKNVTDPICSGYKTCDSCRSNPR